LVGGRSGGARTFFAAALEESPTSRPARPGGVAPNAIAVPTRAAAACRGVPVRPATEVAAAGTTAPLAATATVPPGAAAMEGERPILKGGRGRKRGQGFLVAAALRATTFPRHRRRHRQGTERATALAWPVAGPGSAVRPGC
jgi:hypothetical protein